MKKREFLVSSVGMGAVWPAISAVAASETLGSTAEERKGLFWVNPYLQNVSETEVTVMWMTHTPCLSWVEWGETKELGSKALSIVDGQVSANNTRNKITITGLKPGTAYFYRTFSREIIQYKPYGVTWGGTEKSSIRSFSTPDVKSDSLNAIFFNDIHDQLQTFNALMDQVKGFEYELSIFNGDCFNDPRSAEHVYPLLDAYGQGVRAAERPVIYLRGNHEIRGSYSREWPSVGSNPKGKQYFAMRRGPIQFIFMDCGEDKPDSHWAYSGLNNFEGFHREQAAWLEKEIETPEFKDAKYRVLVHHIPIYGLGAKSYNPWKTLWGPTMNRAGFDLAFHGHTHRPVIHPPMTAGEHNFPVIIGGGPTMENGTITLLEANATELTMKLVGTDGQRIASHTVPART